MKYVHAGIITGFGFTGYVAVRGFGWVPKQDDLAAVLFLIVTLIGVRLISLSGPR